MKNINLKHQRIVIIIIVLIIAISSLAVIRQRNHAKVKQQEIKEELLNKESGVKPKQAQIDDLIRNYRNIYVNLVNDKTADFSFLDNVLNKDSEYYNTVVNDIKNKRSSNINLQVEDIEIGDLQEIDTGYKVKIKETLIVTKDREEKKNTIGYFLLKINNNKIQIENYSDK